MNGLIGYMPLIAIIIYAVIFIFAIVFSIIMSLVYGAMIGAIPLMASLLTGEKKALGIIGAIVCVVAYLAVGFFWAMVACLIFTFIILKGLKKAAPAEEPAVEVISEESATEEDVKTEE